MTYPIRLALLFKTFQELFKIWFQVTMANEVNEALVEVVARAAQIDTDKAEVVVGRMKEEGRYVQDIFGQ
jgi:hypothetical protein